MLKKKEKKIYRKWEERRALDIFKTQILSEFWEENFGSVTLSDWFVYPSPNPCVYCSALWFPSAGPLGYLGWHGAWVLLPFSLLHLCVPSHWILQRQVFILHTLFFSDLQLFRGALCRLLCSALALPWAWPVVFGFLLFRIFFSCFLTSLKCSRSCWQSMENPATFHAEHLLSCAMFIFIRGSWENRTFGFSLIWDTTCRSAATHSLPCIQPGPLAPWLFPLFPHQELVLHSAAQANCFQLSLVLVSPQVTRTSNRSKFNSFTVMVPTNYLFLFLSCFERSGSRASDVSTLGCFRICVCLVDK